MATKRQVLANRANAKQSTGPKTDQGKQTSAQNSLRQATTVVLKSEVKERFDGLAMDVTGSSPEEFTAFLKKQIETWTAVVKAANVRAD